MDRDYSGSAGHLLASIRGEVRDNLDKSGQDISRDNVETEVQEFVNSLSPYELLVYLANAEERVKGL